MIIFEGYGVIIHGDPGGSKICCLLFMHAEVLIAPYSVSVITELQLSLQDVTPPSLQSRLRLVGL
jgi:hypothetical protein